MVWYCTVQEWSYSQDICKRSWKELLGVV